MLYRGWFLTVTNHKELRRTIAECHCLGLQRPRSGCNNKRIIGNGILFSITAVIIYDLGRRDRLYMNAGNTAEQGFFLPCGFQHGIVMNLCGISRQLFPHFQNCCMVTFAG